MRKWATCQQMQRAQQHQPLMPHETPSRAWQIVGTDLFVINSETYLLVSDYYYKFPFVYEHSRHCEDEVSLWQARSTTTCDQRQWRPLQLRCIEEVR